MCEGMVFMAKRASGVDRRTVVRDVRFGTMATKDVLDGMQPGVEHEELSKSGANKARAQRMYLRLPQVRVPVSCGMPDGSSRECLAEVRVRHENARFDVIGPERVPDVVNGVVYGTGSMSFRRSHSYVVRMVDPDTLDLVRDGDGLPVVTQMTGVEVANMVGTQVHGGRSGEPCATVTMGDRVISRKSHSDKKVLEGSVATRKSVVDVPDFVPDAPEPTYRGTVDARLARKVASVDGRGGVTSLLTEHLVNGVRRRYAKEFSGGTEPWELTRFVATDKERKQGYFEGDSERVVRSGRVLTTRDATVSYRLSFDFDHPAEDGSVPFEMRDCMSETAVSGVVADSEGNEFDASGTVRMPWRPVSVGISYAPGLGIEDRPSLSCMGDLGMRMGKFAKQYANLKRGVAEGSVSPDDFASWVEGVKAIAPETTVTSLGRGEFSVSSKGVSVYRFGDLPYDAELADAHLVQRGVEGAREIRVRSMPVSVTGMQLKVASGVSDSLSADDFPMRVQGRVREAETVDARISRVRVGTPAASKEPPSTANLRRGVAVESQFAAGM